MVRQSCSCSPGRMSGKKCTGKSSKEPHCACLANSPPAMEPAPVIVFTSANAGVTPGHGPGCARSPRLAAI